MEKTNIKWKEHKEWKALKLSVNEENPEIGLLTLNRPEKLNAVNNTLIDNLNSALDYLNRAFDIRVVIVNGEGRLFCAGLDLAGSGSGDEVYDWTNFPEKIKIFWQAQHELSTMIVKLRRIPQPVIAAVHGSAVGFGMALANASDIVISTKETKFINAFIKIGFSGADCASSYFLPRLVGYHRSAELLYTGRDLLAEEAYKWGYVNVLVDTFEELMPAAVKFAADNMLTKSPMGLRLTKEAINFNMDTPSLEAAVKFEDRNQVITAQSDDLLEGVSSFFQKRKPKYKSR